MNGQTIYRIRAPMPGGGLAVYWPGPSFSNYWRSPDWRGSMPFSSNYNQTDYQDSAFAPFGEEYAWTLGGTNDFTGQWAQTELQFYDFLYREYHSVQGRWLRPDPAGLGAVNPANPQSWNRYAYVTNNPLAIVDPMGLNGAQCLFSRHRYSGITSPCPAGAIYDGGYGAGGSLILDGGEIPGGLFGQLGGGESAVQCPDNICAGFYTNQFGVTMYYQYWAFTGYAESADGYFPGLSPVNLTSLAMTIAQAYEQWVSANPGLEIGGQIFLNEQTGVLQYTVVAGTQWGGLTRDEVAAGVNAVPIPFGLIEGGWHSQFGADFNSSDMGSPGQPNWVGTPGGTVFQNAGYGTTCVLAGPNPNPGVYPPC